MLFGTGIDIVENHRIKEAVLRNPRFLERLFSPDEVAYCQARKNPWPHLAARFAAKEAVVKALAGAGRVFLADVEVIKDDDRPKIRLLGRAAELAREAHLAEVTISLSHSRDYAVALAVATMDGKEE